MGAVMSDQRPSSWSYPPTPEGFHQWAQDMRSWNDRNNITSGDLVRQWNEERKNAR